ncbi:MAG TPA: ABC transporter transmembrane domain-containing protein [Oligoflexia bacterium]|nr:ABC transporter transmembrane domain-containing protein [Oligoflexia bacterium]HMR24935.1 ABC transporter transmembrane domain-containing protein [Oligoflexia bacterium]
MKTTNSAPLKTLKLLFALIIKNSKDFALNILFFGLLVSVLSLAIPLSVQTLVNSISFTSLNQPIAVVSILLFIVLISSAIFQVLQTWLIDLFHRKVFAHLGSEVANRIYLAKAELYKNQNVPELINRFFDIFTLQKSLATLMTDGFALFLQLTIGLLFIAFYHPLFLAFDAFLILYLFCIWFFFGQKAIQTAINESKAKYKFVNWLEQSSKAYELLAATKVKTITYQKSENYISSYVEKRKQHFTYLLAQTIMLTTLFAISSSLLLGLGGYLVNQNQLSLGQLVAAEIIVTSILINLSKSSKYLELFYDLVAACEKISHLFSFKIEQKNNKIRSFDRIDISIKDIYISNRDKYFQLSLDIPFKNKVYFHVNESSCKEILLDHLFGQNNTGSGHLFINNEKSNNIPIQDLRLNIYDCGYPNFIEGSIKDNLTLGLSNIDDKEIYKVLELLELEESISTFNKQLNTLMLPNGSPLWKSQLPRLDIARAILLKPKVLILNESFQLLSKERQDKVLDYITSSEHSWTVLHFDKQPTNSKRYDQIVSLKWERKNEY